MNDAAPASAEVASWLLRELVARLEVDEEDVGPDMPFADLGLESAEALSLTFDLGGWCGVKFPETLLWEYSTVRAVAAHVARSAALKT